MTPNPPRQAAPAPSLPPPLGRLLAGRESSEGYPLEDGGSCYSTRPPSPTRQDQGSDTCSGTCAQSLTEQKMVRWLEGKESRGAGGEEGLPPQASWVAELGPHGQGNGRKGCAFPNPEGSVLVAGFTRERWGLPGEA